jgi:hypothetical protein
MFARIIVPPPPFLFPKVYSLPNNLQEDIKEIIFKFRQETNKITTGLFGLRSSGKVLRSFEEISMYKKLELLIVHPIIWVKCVFYSLCKTSWRYVPFVGVYREAEKLCHISMSWDHAGYMFCFAYLIRIHLEKMIHVVTRAFSFFFNVHNSCMLFYFVQCIA